MFLFLPSTGDFTGKFSCFGFFPAIVMIWWSWHPAVIHLAKKKTSLNKSRMKCIWETNQKQGQIWLYPCWWSKNLALLSLDSVPIEERHHALSARHGGPLSLCLRGIAVGSFHQMCRRRTSALRALRPSWKQGCQLLPVKCERQPAYFF